MPTSIATMVFACLFLLGGFQARTAHPARTATAGPEPLVLKAVIPLPGATGRMDHMSVDMQGKRLFASDIGSGNVYVIDTAANKVVHVLHGFGEPQGNYFYENRLYVASGDDGTVKIFDGASYKLLATAPFTTDADDIRFNPKTKTVVVGYSGQKFVGGKAVAGPGGEGDGALGYVQPDGGHGALVPVDAHPEAFEIESNGTRVYINVPDRHEVEVGDLEAHTVTARWHVPCTDNFDMALDEAHRRLFVTCRLPATFVVFDTDTGKVVASLPTAGVSDDMFYDAARRRIYVMGGYGSIDVIEQKDPDHYTRIARVGSRDGSRTALFIPAWNELFVAVSQRLPSAPRTQGGNSKAPVMLVYKVQ